MSEIERIRKNHVAGDHGDHGCITCGDEDVWQPSWPCDAAKLLDALAAVTAERDALETVIADAVSVGEMEGQDFLLMPWSTLRAALAARGGEAAS